MTSPRKSAKQSSGWGGFLQQAVLSVESKLDTILADEDQPSTKAAAPARDKDCAGQGNGSLPFIDPKHILTCLVHSFDRYLQKLISCQDQ